jgi:Protoglobin
MTGIPGYGFDLADLARSPVSEEDLHHLEQTVGWTGDDERLLRMHAEFFRRHADELVDSWRAVIGAQPHLAQWFVGPDGKPDEVYKARVRLRFVQWVVDVVTRPHDRRWLDYQEEIGLRHTPEKKNLTDGRQTASLVPLRYLLAFAPVVAEVRGFLAREIADTGEIEAVQRAWSKAVHLHLALWARAYTREGLW